MGTFYYLFKAYRKKYADLNKNCIGGSKEAPGSLRVKFFFIFMQFVGKKLQNNRLAYPLGELAPPQENPGSATELISQIDSHLIIC